MFTKLKATTQRFFNSRIGDNQAMRLADGNKLIKYIDAIGKISMSNTKFDFLVTDPGGSGLMTLVSNGFADACALNGNVCETNAQGKIYDKYKPKGIAARTSTGVFTITFTPETGSVFNFLTSSIIFGQPPVPAIITVSKSAMTEGVYTVKVVDLTGAPLDAGLNNTLLTFSYNIDYNNITWDE